MAIACVSAEMEKLTQNTQKQQETQHNNSVASWFSPDVGSPTEALRFSALHRYLPSNNEDADAAVVFYSSDEFRMYEFKVRRCTRGRSHDWTECPFMHPGEKARRRDPRRFSYSGNPCPDFRKGCCRRGDACEFAHGVFECWLHPDRYRTQPCKDGRNCTRRVCFFAHCLQQLRNIPAAANPSTSPPSNAALQISSQRNIPNGGASFTTENTMSKNSSIGYLNKSLLSSPESTLIGHHSLSPPQSPHQESSASVFSTYALCNNYSLALPTSSCQAPRKSTDFSNSVSRPSDSAEFEMLQLLQAIRTLEVAYSSPVSPVWPEASLQQQSFHASSFQQQNLRSSPESFQNGLYSTASDLDDNFFEEEVVQQRVESGNDLQAKFYSRIASFQDHCSRYDAIDYSSPDLGWVNELVK